MEEDKGKKKTKRQENAKPSGRSGVPPPDTTGMKYKRHVPKELDKRRFNKQPEIYQDLDEEKLRELANIGCTMREVEEVMGVSHDTVQKFLKDRYGLTWGEFFKKYATDFKVSLRRLQYRSAQGDFDEDGNKYRVYPSVPMQIWLGKQFLDQKDKHEQVVEEKKSIPQFEWATEDTDAIDVTNQKKLSNDEDTEESSIQEDSHE